MQIKDFAEIINQFAPFELCASWDNSGLLIGNPDAGVSKALVTLDVNRQVVEEAIAKGCNLIVSHHPLIFKPVNRIVYGNLVSDMIGLLLKHNIALISAHTNLDNAAKGVNYSLGSALGLNNLLPMAPEDTNNPAFIGDLLKPLRLPDLVAKIKVALDVSHVKATLVTENKLYARIALCGGAGSDLWQIAQTAGADCLLTAEGKHSIGMEAAHRDFLVIDAGHFSTENIVLSGFTDYLHKAAPNTEILVAQKASDPWQIL